jgi:hypothetical protein
MPATSPDTNSRFPELGRRLLLAACLAVLTGCASPPSSRILSPGPQYYGERPVERLSVYVFADMRPEYMPAAFRTTVETGLNTALDQSGIPHTQLRFLDSASGQRLLNDLKSSTLGNTTFVSIGKTINENRSAEEALLPTHRLVVFPKDTFRSGPGAIMDLKWDITDVRTGHLEWSVFTRTPVLFKDMDPAVAQSAGETLVQAIRTELKARAVIP